MSGEFREARRARRELNRIGVSRRDLAQAQYEIDMAERARREAAQVDPVEVMRALASLPDLVVRQPRREAAQIEEAFRNTIRMFAEIPTTAQRTMKTIADAPTFVLEDVRMTLQVIAQMPQTYREMQQNLHQAIQAVVVAPQNIAQTTQAIVRSIGGLQGQHRVLIMEALAPLERLGGRTSEYRPASEPSTYKGKVATLEQVDTTTESTQLLGPAELKRAIAATLENLQRIRELPLTDVDKIAISVITSVLIAWYFSS